MILTIDHQSYELRPLTEPSQAPALATVISALTYECYKYNRQRFPNTTPIEWARIFGPQTVTLEQMFQEGR